MPPRALYLSRSPGDRVKRDLILKAKEAIRRFGMIEHGETVLVAVSGGVDSTVLLSVLNAIKGDLSLRLFVCHLNHNLRGAESDRDMRFVEALAASLGLPFAGKVLEGGACFAPGESLQARARALRYAFLDGAAEKLNASKIALGHNLDDSVETVVMRFLKGSSLAGLSGIPPARGRYIRPLILASRKDIEAYAKENEVGHITDSSNLSVKYLRNDVRKRLIPYLKKRYNPNITDTIGRSSEVLRADALFIEEAALSAYSASVVARTTDTIVMDRSELVSMHRALSSRVFLRAARELIPDIELQSCHIDAFFSLIEGARTGAGADLPSGLVILREYGYVRLMLTGRVVPGGLSVTLKVPGISEFGTYVIKATLLKRLPDNPGGPDRAYFDFGLIKGLDLGVRSFANGDTLRPFGMSGSKKLKDLFIDQKIPRRLRGAVPVVAAGEDIIWVAGVRSSALFSVTGQTDEVLGLELLDGSL